MSSIYIIPNEILHAIFSMLPPYDRVRFADDGVEHDLAQILILRSVSRRFRRIYYGLDFWYNDNSDFSKLLPSNDNKQLQSVRFFSQLYGDENFASCFSRKAGWIFSSLESVITLIAAVPLFRHNARRIILMLDEEEDRSAAIRAVSQCHHVTELAVQVESEDYFTYRPFNLSSVAHAFPFLESLTLTGLCEYEGSLNDTKLKSLVIHTGDYYALNSSLIHFKSAPTLVRLCIINAFGINFRGTNPFDHLVNLTDLRLVPLAGEIWKVLNTTKIKLLHFTTDVTQGDHSNNKVLNMFSSPCFQRLQSLTLNHTTISHHPDKYWMESEEIITVIIRHLRSLDTLELYMAMDTSWCSSFVHLTNLKTLRWGIQKDFESRPLLTPMEGCNWDESRVKALKKFQRIFENFEQKPRVTIDFNCGFDDKYYSSDISQLGFAHNLESRTESARL